MARSRTLPFVLALVAASGCSLIVAPSEIKPGSGGSTSSTTTTGTTMMTSSTGPMCKDDMTCEAMATDCHKGTCGADGNCAMSLLMSGTNCGTVTPTDCKPQSTCDASGACQAHVADDGTYCNDCPAGPGACALCATGACGNCTTRATLKTFQTAHATNGWAFTGGWGLYEQTPPPLTPLGPITAPVLFQRPVVGTDGNRAHPWPGAEHEASNATSPPGIIPAVLSFQSWSYDEGNNFDQKTISVSVDNGASYVVVAVCPPPSDPNPYPFPFCHPGFDGSGIAGTWQPVNIDLAAINHPELIGKVGSVRFGYDTTDEASGFELGWYVDALNFATDCACTADADCALENGTCATGTCDVTTHECVVTPKNANMPCSMTTSECSSGPTCDQFGLCNPNWIVDEGNACKTCSEGLGECDRCGGGVCLNCPAVQDFGSVPLGYFGPNDLSHWQLTGSWNVVDQAPPDSATMPLDTLPFGAGGNQQWVLGSDGPKVAPYYTAAGGTVPTATETSFARTPTTLIPTNITFKSWNQDRGGMSSRDVKRVRVTTDAGTTFTTLLDCNGGANSTLPLCTQVMSRAASDWDMITIPTGALAGKTGIVEFDYDTVDAGFDWERGWYIDDLNVARCVDH